MNHKQNYELFSEAAAELYQAEEAVKAVLKKFQDAGFTAQANDVQVALNELADTRYAIDSDAARNGVAAGVLP